MRNVYSVTNRSGATCDFARPKKGRTENLQSQPGVFPDYSGPIVDYSAAG